MSKKMNDHAKGWKSPDERREMKREARGNAEGRQVAKKEAKAAPPNTTGMKGKGGKDTPDSKGPSAEGFTTKRSMKKPKGAGC